MNRSMRALAPWIDRLFGLALAGTLAMAALTALPGPALAADTVVGSGQAASEPRTVGEFNAIAVSGGIRLKVRQGPTAAVVVSADNNLLPLLDTVVDGDKILQLRWKKGSSLRTRSRASVDVVAPQLRAVSSSGSADIDLDTMKSPQLALSISGSGDIRARGLANDELSIAISGSGDVQAAGQAGRLRVKIAGSGDVKTDALQADDVSVRIAGSGDASVRADKTLDVSVAGSGDVVYSGNASVTHKVAGSGSVRKR